MAAEHSRQAFSDVPAVQTASRTAPRRSPPFLRIFVWLLLISAVAYLLSATYAFVRLLYLVTLGWGVLTAGVLLWRASRRRRWVRAVVALALVPLALYLPAAGQPPEAAAVRAAYTARLRGFARTLYIWGGETHVGIDCSGLARIALCEAMVTAGVRTGNPRLLGPLLWSFWWQDLGAGALREGYGGYTVPIGHAPRLAGWSAPYLRPGDLAIPDTTDHVLIYLGNGEWIEANPEDGRVVINTATAGSERGYFTVPVTLVRWWLFAPAVRLDTRVPAATMGT